VRRLFWLLLFFFYLAFFFFSCSSSSTPTQPPTPVAPTIAYFNSNPGTITLESASELSWSTSNATKVEIDQGVGEVSLSGTKSVKPDATVTYTLTAHNGSLQATKACVITVEWKPFVVYITDTGTKYHRDGCQYLSQSKIQSTLGDACQKGFGPCSVCKPPNCR
jgi:hypothetical protein